MMRTQIRLMPSLTPAALAWTLVVCVLLAAGAASADIYRYVDENGVAHYTNIPTRGAYSLYMRERPASRRLNGSPIRYDGFIQEAADRHQISFELLKAVIKVESGFNPRAISKKGARGLMQIMPQNFASLGISDPYNPRQSIMGGARYLRQMLNRFQGRTTLALAAYNAGPTAVEKHRTIPPYDETQAYVRKVMAEYHRLRQESGDADFKWRIARP